MAIATVADVVPLTGENRIIVKHGLAGLDKVRNPGLRALLDVAGFHAGTAPTARQVAFQIAPRINAAGRMDTAKAVVEMFLTGDAARAPRAGQQLHDQNDRAAAGRGGDPRNLRAASRSPMAHAALVYYGGDWHRGVLGIVASRLVERFHRPVFVLGTQCGGRAGAGSGRSIPAFHLLDALESMPELFVRFGGHAHAAGVTHGRRRACEEFRERFNAYAAAQSVRRRFPAARWRSTPCSRLREISEQPSRRCSRWRRSATAMPRRLFAALNVEVAAPPVIMKEKHLR